MSISYALFEEKGFSVEPKLFSQSRKSLENILLIYKNAIWEHKPNARTFFYLLSLERKRISCFFDKHV